MYELFNMKPGDHISLCFPDGSRFEVRQAGESFEVCDRDGKPVFARVMGNGQASAVQDVELFCEGGVIHPVTVPAGIRVTVRDYDVEGPIEDGETEIDDDGNAYYPMVFEGA